MSGRLWENKVQWHNANWELIKASPRRYPFQPQDAGVQTGVSHGIFGRPFLCDYAIQDDCLVLTQVSLSLTEEDFSEVIAGRGSVLFGTQTSATKIKMRKNPPRGFIEWLRRLVPAWLGLPSEWETDYFGTWVYYQNINHPLPYTGGIVLGRFETDMLFNPPPNECFPNSLIHELVFENGRLVSATDHTEHKRQILAELDRIEALMPPFRFDLDRYENERDTAYDEDEQAVHQRELDRLYDELRGLFVLKYEPF